MDQDVDRVALLLPLGFQRLRLLDCLGNHTPDLPGYLKIAPGDDVFDVFRRHMLALVEQWAEETHPVIISLLAAGQVLSGDVSAAQRIIDCLPEEAPDLSQGKRYAPLAPMRTLAAVLPLPPSLVNIQHWRASSPSQFALRAWLASHGRELRWIEADGVYRYDVQP